MGIPVLWDRVGGDPCPMGQGGWRAQPFGEGGMGSTWTGEETTPGWGEKMLLTMMTLQPPQPMLQSSQLLLTSRDKDDEDIKSVSAEAAHFIFFPSLYHEIVIH